MSKHTPGPWKLDGAAYEEDHSVLGPDGKLVIAGEYDGWMVPFACRGSEEGAANARLVSAAPELLASLKRIVNGDTGLKAITQAYKAIAKAEGR